MSSVRIAVIDDDRTIQMTLKTVLERRGYQAVAAYSAKQGLELMERESVQAILLDLGLPDQNGLDVLRRLRERWPHLPVIVVTANDSLNNAIESIKLGAFHFLSKPYAPEGLLNLIHQALENRQLQQEAHQLRQETNRLQQQLQRQGAHTLIFRSAQMKELSDLLTLVAPSDATVLLVGESGTGKEVIAHLLHQQSARAQRDLVKLNCAAFPHAMIEGELFGYRKGSFTGASQDFPGVLGGVSGGTLFLDEIAEMPIELQTRFLRVLQDHEYRPLGSTQTYSSDFRLIAATNQEPQRAIREGRLREDLYYRLNTFQIQLPPLRDRAEDIPDLAVHFVEKFQTRLGKPKLRISPEVFDRLLHYSWPGNVRELQNVIERAVVLCRGGEITPDQLPPQLRRLSPTDSVTENAHAENKSKMASSALNLVDREKTAILAALAQTNGNKKKAADLLGIHRPTLYAKMKKYGLDQEADSAASPP